MKPEHSHTNRDDIHELEHSLSSNESNALQAENPSVRRRIVGFQEDHPFASTMLETTVVWAGRQALRAAASRTVSLKIGHGWQQSSFGKKFDAPAVAVATAAVAAPYAEELILRKLPSDKLDGMNRLGPQKSIGAAAALLFAAGHVGRDALPITQFVGGLNYWRLQRNRGYKHAVLAHATHNSLSLLAGGIGRLKTNRSTLRAQALG